MALGFGTAFAIGGSAVGVGDVQVGEIVLDSAGNTYVTGGFMGSANFDPAGSAAGIRNSGSSGESTYVARYSPSDALMWVDTFTPPSNVTSSSNSTGLGLAVDSNTGAVYAAGEFAGSIVFVPDGGAALTYTTNAQENAFVVKLNPDGSLIPDDIRTFGGSSPNAAGAVNVKLSPDGTHVYVGGFYTGLVNVDPGKTNVTLTDPYTNGQGDGFVLDLSSDFTLRYAVTLDQPGSVPNGMRADDSGNLYVVGASYESDGIDAFVEEFNFSGSLTHTQRFGGPSSGVAGANAEASEVVLDGAGNVYISGFFKGTSVPFGIFGGPTSVPLSSAGSSDMFLLKLDPSFNLVWGVRFGSNAGASGANDEAIDGNGHILVAGYLAGPSNYGTSDSGPIVLGNGITSQTAFVLEVDSNGNLVGAETVTGTSDVYAIAANAADAVVMDGYYRGSATLGGVTLGSAGASGAFLANVTGASTPTSIATSPPTAPIFAGEMPLTKGKGKRKKVIAFELQFSGALETSVAENTSHYRVVQPGRTRKAAPKVIAVRAATIGPAGTSVTLVLRKYNTAKPLSLTASGLVGANGTQVATVTATL